MPCIFKKQRKFSINFRIMLKVRIFRKLQKTGIFRTKIFGDDFYAHFLSSKTWG